MSPSPRARLARIEATAPGRVDLVAEAAEYGELVWARQGMRCYTQETADGSRLAVFGGRVPLVYELVGVDARDLT